MEWGERFAAPIPRSFYARSTRQVARELLGQVLVRKDSGGWRASRLVETEAYVARDPASHAFRGPTARNRSMFKAPGTLYVYRIHQVHCANAVTRPGEAVLLRAAEPLTEGLAPPRGPGRLCRALGLTLEEDGLDLVTGAVRIVPGVAARAIVAAPRVGITRATRPRLRFAIRNDPWVSIPRPWSTSPDRRRA